MTTERDQLSLTWHDISLGLWSFSIAFGLLATKFLRWFLIREITNFQQRTIDEARAGIQKEIALSEDRIEMKLVKRDKKLEEISENLKVYKKNKHDIQNENAALTGSMEICKEGIDAATKLIEKYEKALNEKR